MALQQELALTGKRIGVRRGSQAAEYKAFGDMWKALGGALAILEEAETALDNEQEWAYSSAWDDLLAAQDRYLDVTAKALNVESSEHASWRSPRRRKRSAAS